MDGALVVAADRMPDALAAVAVACDVEPEVAVAALTGLGFAVVAIAGAMEALIVNGFRGELEGQADAAVAALAPFVEDGTTLGWEDDNGNRWRYRIIGDKVVEQVPVVLWREFNDRAPRTGGVLASLTITRDTVGFAQWWAQEADQEAIIETLEYVAEAGPGDVEHALHSLMLEVFQSSPGAVEWLRVTGLGRGVGIGYLTLDIDPAHDADGILDGVEVVLNLWTHTPDVSLTVSVYTDHARAVLAPQSISDPAAGLAEVIDMALELVNRDIAARDRFVFGARDVLD
jgi:hypothetical protein